MDLSHERWLAQSVPFEWIVVLPPHLNEREKENLFRNLFNSEYATMDHQEKRVAVTALPSHYIFSIREIKVIVCEDRVTTKVMLDGQDFETKKTEIDTEIEKWRNKCA